MKVRDALVPATGTATLDQPIAEVARSIADSDGVVAVLTEGQPVGVVDSTDIVRAVATHGERAGVLTAAEIISGDIETVAQDSDLDSARDHMRARQVRELAVMDGDRLVGVVSRTRAPRLVDPELEVGGAAGTELLYDQVEQLSRFFEGFEEGIVAALELAEESMGNPELDY